VTGPVTRNMAEAVRQTFEATASPKLVVAVGACGCSGGIFAASHAVVGAVDSVLPLDGYIPGCPPTPPMLVTGILEVLRRSQRRIGAKQERRALRVSGSLV
jgi:Ni,Fe-hydrogenase III small subunit